MKLVLLLTTILIFIGCEGKINISTTVDNIIPQDKTIVASEFILTCAKNANPLSDEEGEDLVKQCQFTAEKIFGIPKVFFCYSTARGCFTSQRVDCNLARTIREKEACMKLGWKEQ
jgi:hypothetical protein